MTNPMNKALDLAAILKFGLPESTYLLHENLMLDISMRMGLNDAAPDVGMATGFTVRY
jgi:hypothetical protein